MKIHRIFTIFGMLVTAAALTRVGVLPSWAQKGPAPASPLAPTISLLMPAGVQRGQTVDLVISGTSLSNPTGVAPGFPAKITIPSDDKNGQDATKFKVRIEVPADTPLGWYPFRVATSKGISNLRVLCVDDLPQLVSTAGNRSKATAQALPMPCAVTGSVAAESGDYYKFSVKAGQRLSFDCLARRLGSPIDAQMTVYDAKSMRELAYDNDSPGCQTDPRISYTFKEAGEYLVEIKDVLNRGGADFFYRLRLGDFPLATTPIPMAAKRGAKAKVSFAGPAVAGVAPVEVDVPNDPTVKVVWVLPKGAAGLHGWPVPLTVSDHDEIVEQEPNNDALTANRISVPGGVTGRFPQGDKTDFYVFAAKKGQKLVIEAHSLEYYSPTLVYMNLKHAKSGAEIAKSNPQAPPPGDQRMDVTAAEDGDMVLEVQHLYFAGGPSESYRVTVRTPSAGFDLTLPSDRVEVAPGGVAAIPVQVVRKGYAGPIELSTKGPAALTGTATIKAGQSAGILLIATKPDVPMGPYLLSVVGKAMVDGQPIVQVAGAKAQVVQALNGLPYPPMHLQEFVALAVKEKAPFSLAIKMDPPEGVPGGKAKVTITAVRDTGFDDEITLTPPTGLPTTIPAPKTVAAIGKGKTETSFPLDLNAKTPLGEYFVNLTAKSKYQGKDVAATVPPLMLNLGLPFDLRVEPGKLSLKPGEKMQLKITAIRKGGYTGPITLDVRKLPANVTAAKVSIPADKTTADIEITAAANAMPGETIGVDVAGTASALNNLTNASPAFTLRVEKK
jgi:hypothetical protein